jgi:signal transduction histidine kinase
VYGPCRRRRHQSVGGETEHHLILLIREALQNAIRHGAPQRVCISLQFEPGRLDVAVEDNGAGFDGSLDRSEQSQHYGLLGMRERAERVGGDFSLTSAPGRGTQVRVTVPIRKP